eukprot:CAMPEP_0201665478 /NCGR_PEP_ID=MMETSP0494-20130426/6608_1 /ASSEMBLY_ACC=CAM_ASM_000839 /TAXON_ID=420259 /ORGANISM="Thalassiosira gravida, Strain GMp14c1" /LENGTH=1606 /DNA_ID=CAMNT_0048144447 /DNA_START=213 /DNA_END=5033 /DNA_ORIENTATION=+
MSPYPAKRRNGACTGSLWKSHSRSANKSTAFSTSSTVNNNGAQPPQHQPTDLSEETSTLDGILAEANERQRAHEFCVLVGNALWSYTDVWAYAKGDSPTSEIRIVGASAWNPPSLKNKHSGRSSSSSQQSSTSLASEAGTSTSSLLFKSVDFLIVSYSGTHVRCSAPTPADKDKWLAALHAGLEGNIVENRVETLTVLSRHHHHHHHHHHHPHGNGKIQNGEITNGGDRNSISDADMAQSAIDNARTAFESETSFRPFLPPLPRAEDRNTKRKTRNTNNGNPTDYIMNNGDGGKDRCRNASISTGYASPCDDRNAPPSEVHCTSCGRYPPEHAMRIDAAPLPEYGMEVRVDLCHDCSITQGVLRHVRYLGWLYEVEGSDRAAIRMAWEEVRESVLDRLQWENDGLEGEEEEGTNGDLPPPAGILLELVRSEKFLAYRQRSNTLNSLCCVLEMNGLGCASDFLESLEECSRAAESSCLYSRESTTTAIDDESIGEQQQAATPTRRTKETICLKKEAFKVAGDMSAALKLLYEYALPVERRKNTPSLKNNSRVYSSYVGARDNADMLAAILEFFLDLCDEGQMDSVEFFWPQLCHVHMQMLPPRDTEEMIRVELMEDFLLTVATRYSVHLALALVWGCTADLEESLGASNCNPLSRRRRFAVLRFVSELESLLFDFDGGWGGGGVSLHGMLSPPQRQAALLRDAMSLLQLRRRFGSHYLTRSVRLDKLRAEALESMGEDGAPPADGGAAVRARIARNAAYFSSHVAFARRLGDIAEKLRFTSIERRDEALRRELMEINASGKLLGGDPLNRLCGDDQFRRIVHVPDNEGHVFHSKERTPVLLLAESVEDSSEMARKTSEPLTAQQVTDITGMDMVGKINGNFVSDERKDPPTEQNQSGDDDSQASISSCSTQNTTHDHAGGEVDVSSCPSSPCSRHRAHTTDSTESPGRLPSHGVLSLTPRASEATNVTQEGKEMMADMIATLIVNQKNHALAPPLDIGNSDNVHDSNGDMGQPHQPTELDTRRDQYRTVVEDVMAQSPHEFQGSNRSLSTPASSSVPLMSSGIDAKRISALGPVFPKSGQSHSSSAEFSKSAGIHLTSDGQFRRDVLFAIMERGMRGSNVIAKGAATAARRAIQTMDRKRAIALMNEPANDSEKSGNDNSNEQLAENTLGVIKQNNSGITINASIDEGEVIEALRLLIIQNQVAQENLSLENAVKTHGTQSGSTEFEADSDVPHRNRKGVDAGEVDQRLAGCGQISSSILSVLRLWKGGIVSNGELLELVQKDLQFLKQSAAFGSADENKLIEDSAFWGRFSFGERWAEKKARLAASSPHGSLPGWDLIGCIVKSNDDLRQEVFVMQLIGLCAEAFDTAGLDLWVHPYDIVATGLSTGIIECVRNAMSFDSLKKRPGYGTDGLVGHFQRMTEIAADPFKALNEAKQNFVSSLAAYSLMSYLFMFKDRHNGNLLLDTAGHVIHIDFGFVFGIAPGGSFSLEQSTPFKLTDEMLDVMGGLGSPLFSEFVTLFCCGFLALQAHADTFLTVVEVTCRGSNFPCFDGKDPEEVLSKLRERFCPDLNKSQTVAYALDLIKFATTSYGTKQYDYFQYLSQGIAT